MPSLDDIRAHWDSRAALGETAGTQDLVLKQLEQQAIIAELGRVPYIDGTALEIGCGLGETATRVALHFPVKRILAVDSSSAMIEAAQARSIGLPTNIRFQAGDALTPPEGPFNVIYTQRCLINLPSWELQKQAIDAIADRLVPGGRFLMCEHSEDGLSVINETRRRYGVAAIEQPWHNRYLREDELMAVTSLRLIQWRPFSAAYYFASRVLNAIYAKEHLCEPAYDSPINQLATADQLDVRASFAQARLYVWEKP